MRKFKVGDKVRLTSTGSTVSSFGPKDGKSCYGAEKGNVVIILGIVPYGGDANEEDPIYYGEKFNVRGYELELVEPFDQIINNYSIYLP